MTCPNWWFILSGVFFGVMSITFMVIAYILIRHLGMIEVMLQDIQKIVKKLDSIADKADYSFKEITDITRNINRVSYSLAERFLDAGSRVSQSAQKASFALLGFTTLKKILGALHLFGKK